MQMSVMADSSAASTIQLANSIESQALTTSPGSAPQLEAQALASELSSMAVEHKLLANQLRAEATRLGYRGVEFKQGATTSSKAVQGIFGGAK
jgi:acyl CoA:acetate/3-ketoacid CoA transferase alpha subunit